VAVYDVRFKSVKKAEMAMTIDSSSLAALGDNVFRVVFPMFLNKNKKEMR